MFTLNDEIWLDDNDLNLAEIFGVHVDMKGLTKIMFRQIVDKSLFPKKVIDDYDENGEMIKVVSGGLFSFREMVMTQKGKMAIIDVFSKLFELSRPKETGESEETNGKK